MSYSPSSPVTGAAQTGLTSPTYTLTDDIAPNNNGIQHAITALGGTQTGVDVHSVSKPFTVTIMRPRVFKPLGRVNPVTGVLSSVPRNTYKLLTRKGVVPLEGQAPVVFPVYTVFEVPAGADTADPASIRAALSCHIGILSDVSAGIGDSCILGVF